MDHSAITLRKYGEAMHLAPNGEEGFCYSAEEVYEMLQDPFGISGTLTGKGTATGKGSPAGKGKERRTKRKNGRGGPVGEGGTFRDDHSLWSEDSDSELWDLWTTRVVQSARAVEIRDPSNERGLVPGFAKRILRELTQPQVDWRTILGEFVQPEVNDYSFFPPDRRFSESPFFLPDYNGMGEGDEVHDILFMVDTSGSVSDEMLTAAMSEIKGAIEQFNGRLQGWIGFFDMEVTPPVRLQDGQSIRMLNPIGGGGTDFFCVFNYVHGHMERRPAYIVILTDGYAPFPKESAARGIPVLWLLSNQVVDPPWGKVARISL